MKNPIPPFHECKSLIHSTLRHWNVPEPYDDHLQESYFVYTRCAERHDPKRSKFSTYFTYALLWHFQTMERKEYKERKAAHLFSLQHPLREKDPQHENLLLFDIYHHASLTNRERFIFQYCYNGHTVEEIASATGKSPSTIKRARKQIKLKVMRWNRLTEY
ncbi:RNA polymerase sigma factor, sigma-70 family [Halobacillus karajensis]|uniref:RNA polymerase sigma factor, sigma-70 family n=2 Tax=Halobacillus karajensis TaxID=195088 RepID=A0A059NX33_9BACI|nr:LuxR C-terminal-related transcriptional regulator [Halobacillus karajensis]CDQ18898.1 RNA polymerase sigma factor, sigma-70 family [Halobacillus karajensis]CDQ23029.1 RNA polymerase sigma factor, sigma-70 family [Halobacillus karajensis]CDQ26511.1 RNA polymerase sigma factor, sigma-70 family [Halobacillus karajensis]SEH44637.1 RNA polymerase sigma factor, sigma-70 family [Halobacillus karajensis]